MKIVYTCSYAHPSISGVWNRVENIAKLMIKKGHEVHVLTSNLIAGTDKTAQPHELYKGIYIHRFPVKAKLSKYQLMFSGDSFIKTLDNINPDIIDCQTYRHPEARTALKYALKNKIPCILTTHAPFLPISVRGKKLSLFAGIYDYLIGKRIMNKYSKIFRISKWELKYLSNLKVKRNKIIYSPNGIPKEFFEKNYKRTSKKNILFLGRIEPRKQVHILIKAFSIISKKYPNSNLILVGPIENVNNYDSVLKDLIKKLDLSQRVHFLGPVYNLKRKINLISDSKIYVLPSTWEGFPQSLIETMALGRCIIASDCDGNKEVIVDKKTGFLFPIGNFQKLAEKLDFCLSNNTQKVQKNAKKCAENFHWENITNNVEKAYKSLI